jgi:hypothetical protein
MRLLNSASSENQIKIGAKLPLVIFSYQQIMQNVYLRRDHQRALEFELKIYIKEYHYQSWFM